MKKEKKVKEKVVEDDIIEDEIIEEENNEKKTAIKALVDKGILKKTLDGVKIMGNGELQKKLTVKAAKFTASAKEKIEALGGKAEVI